MNQSPCRNDQSPTGAIRPAAQPRRTVMTTKIKFAAALTDLALAATFARPSSEAQARPRGWGIAAGLIGAGIVAGSIAAASAEPVYVGGYRACKRVAQYDAWGNFIGTTKVCRYYY